MCPVMKGGCMVVFKTMATARIFAVICGRLQNSERPQQTNKLRCGEMDKWLDEYVEQVMAQQVVTNGIFKKKVKKND